LKAKPYYFAGLRKDYEALEYNIADFQLPIADF